MLISIVRHTPPFVWALLAGLVAIGLLQTRERVVGATRLVVGSLGFVGLSLWSVVGAFGARPLAELAWAAALVVSAVLARRRLVPATATTVDGAVRVPGSWLPLALILALFALKYGAAVTFALHPALARDAAVAAACSVAYGGFSGLFLGRSLGLAALAARRADLQPA